MWIAEGFGDRLIPKDLLVLCKECKWFYPEYEECHAPHWDINQGCIYPSAEEDDYCKWGEFKQ